MIILLASKPALYHSHAVLCQCSSLQQMTCFMHLVIPSRCKAQSKIGLLCTHEACCAPNSKAHCMAATQLLCMWCNGIMQGDSLTAELTLRTFLTHNSWYVHACTEFPTLSEQMAVAPPIVSQAANTRTKLLSFIIFFMLYARDMVTAKGRPSGTATTTMVTPKMKKARGPSAMCCTGKPLYCMHHLHYSFPCAQKMDLSMQLELSS